jgi:VanZ like family
MVDFHLTRWTGAAAVQPVIRLAFWFVVLMLILLTVVPPSIRPSGVASHHMEHFASFALAGILYYLSYAHHLLTRLAAAVLFAGGLEVLQLFVPGRHARLVDFVMDALGACIGIVLVFGFAVVQTFRNTRTGGRGAGGQGARRD